jgi:hypothetical protein
MFNKYEWFLWYMIMLICGAVIWGEPIEHIARACVFLSR